MNKKIICLMVSCTMLFSILGCSSKKESSEKDDNDIVQESNDEIGWTSKNTQKEIGDLFEKTFPEIEKLCVTNQMPYSFDVDRSTSNFSIGIVTNRETRVNNQIEEHLNSKNKFNFTLLGGSADGSHMTLITSVVMKYELDNLENLDINFEDTFAGQVYYLLADKDIKSNEEINEKIKKSINLKQSDMLQLDSNTNSGLQFYYEDGLTIDLKLTTGDIGEKIDTNTDEFKKEFDEKVKGMPTYGITELYPVELKWTNSMTMDEFATNIDHVTKRLIYVLESNGNNKFKDLDENYSYLDNQNEDFFNSSYIDYYLETEDGRIPNNSVHGIRAKAVKDSDTNTYKLEGLLQVVSKENEVIDLNKGNLPEYIKAITGGQSIDIDAINEKANAMKPKSITDYGLVHEEEINGMKFKVNLERYAVYISFETDEVIN